MTAVDFGSAVPIGEARRATAQALRKAGIDTPDLDARVLIAHALELGHTALAANACRVLTAQQCEHVAALIERRLAREPVARIIGTKEFWGLSIAITPDVLVPRPDTETVVEAALEATNAVRVRRKRWRIADLGTGSGILLLALLHELPEATGIGTDISRPALCVANGNAERLALATRASFAICEFGAALSGGFDLIVSNPPYIAHHEMAELEPEVSRYDPAIALDGGLDGLAAYRVIAADALRLIAPGGTMVLEIGAAQAHAVGALFAVPGLSVMPVKIDLAGRPRALIIRRKA